MTEPSASDQHSVTLRPNRHAPRMARRLVQETCRRSGLPSRVVDNAMFVAGELVTHSIRQAHGQLRMQVVLAGDEVTLRVEDDAPVPPVISGAAFGTNRCWEVVTRLSASFGYRCDGRSREMWALLRADPRAADPGQSGAYRTG